MNEDTMQHIQPGEERAYVIGPYQDPIARVKPGETFEVSTLDAFGNRIDSVDADLAEIVRLPYVNPCTGPIYVEGARPGDTLVVRIEDIRITRDYAVSCIIPEFGGLCGTVYTRVLNEPLEQRILLQPITGDGVVFDPGACLRTFCEGFLANGIGKSVAVH